MTLNTGENAIRALRQIHTFNSQSISIKNQIPRTSDRSFGQSRY